MYDSNFHMTAMLQNGVGFLKEGALEVANIFHYLRQSGSRDTSICCICKKPLGRNRASIRIVRLDTEAAVSFHRACFDALKQRARSTFAKLRCPECHARFEDTLSDRCLHCGYRGLQESWGLLKPDRTCFLCGLEIYESVHRYVRFGGAEAHEYSCHKVCTRKARYAVREGAANAPPMAAPELVPV